MFTFRRVETEHELEEVFKLRYQVYCLECDFESPEDHPGGLESDEFDKHSVHFIAIDSQDNIVGTVRLIRDSEIGFPIERFCKIDIDTSRIPRDGIAEISRLAISKMYRRRAGDGIYAMSGAVEDPPEQQYSYNRRRRPEIVLGLLKALYRESKWQGVVNWYAAMEKPLFALLKRYGFVFREIGEETHYHGLRTPYIARIGNIESTIARTKPDLFHFFTDWDRAPVYSI